MVEACVGWADGILSRVACLCRVAGLAPGRGSIQARCPALFWTGVPDSFAAEGSALLKAKLVIRLKQRVVEVELAHLLAYNVITRTPVNIDVGALPSPNCRKAWEIYALDYELLKGWLLENLKNTRPCHICGLCPPVNYRFLSPCM